MRQDRFSAELDTLNERIEQIRRDVAPHGRQPLIQEALSELHVSLEELRVADEELRVQNEMLLDASQTITSERARYRELFDAAPDAYLVTDKEGLILEANRRAYGLLQVGPRSLVGRPMAGLVPLENRRVFRDLLVAASQLPDGEERTLPISTKRGVKPIDMAVTVSVSAATPPGRTQTLRWLLRDTSERTRAELERYKRLVEETHDYAVILMDSEGRILTWNRGAVQIFGWSEAEAQERVAAQLLADPDREADMLRQEMGEAARTGRATEERWHLKKDGTRFWGSGVLLALRSGAGQLHWFAKVMRDLTAQKEAETRQAQELAYAARIAETFQRALLPELAAGAFAGLRVAAFYEAAWKEALVGGDFYDVFPLSGGRVALVVGDVSGKGLGAAVRMADLKSVLRAFLREHRDPAGALSRVNEYLCDCQRLEGREEHAFATMALVVLDPETGAAETASAGAEPPLVLHTHGQTETIPVQGRLLGVAEAAQYVRVTFRLGPGDTLLLATDGLTEARHGNQFLDPQGLAEIACRVLTQPDLTAAGRAIVSEVRAFAGGVLRDDACLLLVRRTGDD